MTTIRHMLAVIWFLIVGLFLIFYVVLDGFDLGVGMLSLGAGNEDRRTVMMASLSSIWDANESWLIVVGGTLFGAFPLAYAVILSALYVPIIMMLFGLILRAVAFEFHELSRRKRPWGLVFGLGSLTAAASQGFALGALITGVVKSGARTNPGTWDWLSPFSALVAAGVVAGYALLGATYLILKTEGATQAPCRKSARWIALFVVAVGGAVTVYTPLRFSWVAAKWFSPPGMYYYAVPVVVALGAFVMLFRSLRRGFETAPFVWSLMIFLSSFVGLAVTLFPFIVPGALTIYRAAADTKTLVFMLSMVSFFIPIMIAYNAYQYLVFRGKVHADTHVGEGR
ncbi:MAG: cytochrome d ubiquinol oxidase subunit II [Acidiferrobacteraceae bacterium]